MFADPRDRAGQSTLWDLDPSVPRLQQWCLNSTQVEDGIDVNALSAVEYLRNLTCSILVLIELFFIMENL